MDEFTYELVDGDVAEANKDLRRLITLEVRVMLLSDIYSTAGYAQGRASVTLLEALTRPEAGDIVSELGSLHRSCMWENIQLKNVCKPTESQGTSASTDDLLQIGDGTAALSTTAAAEANGA